MPTDREPGPDGDAAGCTPLSVTDASAPIRVVVG
jgi:hypothetical protein